MEWFWDSALRIWKALGYRESLRVLDQTNGFIAGLWVMALAHQSWVVGVAVGIVGLILANSFDSYAKKKFPDQIDK